MRFGFVLPNNWGIEDSVAVADMGVEAEALGLHSVFVNHHVLNVGYIADRLDDRPYHDALTVLTWVAARTERVKIGTSVLVMPYLHPMVLAKALATLDQMTGGRVIAGLGVGSLAEENEILGVGYQGRGPFGDEFIAVMKALWAPGTANHVGANFTLREVVASPKPHQQPLPIWIGGSGAPARRRAAALGHGWHPMCSVGGLAKRMPSMLDSLAANDRHRDSLVIAPRVDVSEVPDADAVAAWADAGADELIISVSSGDLNEQHRGLSHIASLL